jgi:hypothetical protein
MTLLLLGGIALYCLSSNDQAKDGAPHRREMANDPKRDSPALVKATTPDPLNRHTDNAQESDAAANAAIKSKIDAQPELTSIPIVAVGDLVNKVFGDYSNQDDRSDGQLSGTLVAVSGIVDLRGFEMVAPPGATVHILYEDGTPFAGIKLKAADALEFSEVEDRIGRGQDLRNLPAEYNLVHNVSAILGPDSIAAVRELHDGNPLILVGQFEVASYGTISLYHAHVPPPNEVLGNQVIVSRPISVRDLGKERTW